MTPQEKLQAVTEQIRKGIPRLMELSYGCLMKFWDNSIYTTVLSTHREIAFIDRNSDYCHFQVITPDQINVIEVIGHEILLSDVFEWLGTLFNFTIDHKGIIYQEFDYYFEGGLDRDYNEVAKVDFSKPYLKDQSEEFWDFLYHLIK